MPIVTGRISPRPAPANHRIRCPASRAVVPHVRGSTSWTTGGATSAPRRKSCQLRGRARSKSARADSHGSHHSSLPSRGVPGRQRLRPCGRSITRARGRCTAATGALESESRSRCMRGVRGGCEGQAVSRRRGLQTLAVVQGTRDSCELREHARRHVGRVEAATLLRGARCGRWRSRRPPIAE